jgi:dienelactone hydrolase
LEFLAPFIADVAATRRRISAAFDTMTKEAAARGIRDGKRLAGIGYCYGGSSVVDLARAGRRRGGRLRPWPAGRRRAPAKKGTARG